MPETRFAKSGQVNIAYQVVGEGSLSLVFVFGYRGLYDLKGVPGEWRLFRVTRVA